MKTPPPPNPLNLTAGRQVGKTGEMPGMALIEMGIAEVEDLRDRDPEALPRHPRAGPEDPGHYFPLHGGNGSDGSSDLNFLNNTSSPSEDDEKSGPEDPGHYKSSYLLG